MHFVKGKYHCFPNFTSEVSNEIVLWGGEAAASILTEQLIPEILSVYTTESWQNIGQLMNLVPDEIIKLRFYKYFGRNNI